MTAKKIKKWYYEEPFQPTLDLKIWTKKWRNLLSDFECMSYQVASKNKINYQYKLIFYYFHPFSSLFLFGFFVFFFFFPESKHFFH